jgi:hypothetical protein
LLGRPITAPSVAEQRDAIEFQLAETLKLHDDAHAGRIFRKFGISYANLHPMRDEVRQAFINARDTQAVRNVLDAWYHTGRQWPATEPRDGLRDLIAAGAAE